MKDIKIVLRWLVLLVVVIIISISYASVIKAESPQEKLERLNQEITQYQEEISKLESQANTLSNQIAQYDAQIKLTTLRITQTEEKIDLLGGRIELIQTSLDSLMEAFQSRVQQTYKMARVGQPFLMLAASDNLTEAISSFHYLRRIQEADQNLLERLENTKVEYSTEKSEQEKLQDQLNVQKLSLDRQKLAKSNLLLITKNDEKKYQDLISRARAELAAIQDIIAGKGEEVEVRTVGDGERIASVIPGASPCSSGTHLHFEVAKGGANYNPADLLSSKTVEWDNSPDGPFSFNGSWPWPLNDPIRITQGYGMTYFAATLHYYGGSPHTGVDMVNSSNTTVKAVQAGKLYQGAIGCGGGTLRYVRVQQNDGYDTYYLHVNY
jgi:peptidoglycan hydrolase CwlO-like protein